MARDLAGLDVDDFDPDDCSIVVRGKRNKQRTVYWIASGCRHLIPGSVTAAMFSAHYSVRWVRRAK